MHRSTKRIVVPLFLLLVVAVLFVPEVRADTLLNFSFGNGDWAWTLPQNPVPTSSPIWSDVPDSFAFFQVPVFEGSQVQTFDMEFFRLPGTNTTDFMMTCDPFRIVFDPIELTCDYFNRVEITGTSGIWSGPDSHPTFIPGVYGSSAGLVITATPEPSTLALLLMSFATLFLLAVGVRPSHRS